jgi:hypothetical protein
MDAHLRMARAIATVATVDSPIVAPSIPPALVSPPDPQPPAAVRAELGVEVAQVRPEGVRQAVELNHPG